MLVVKTNKQTTNKTNVKVNVKKISIDTVTRKSGTISVSWKKNKRLMAIESSILMIRISKNVKNKKCKKCIKDKD